jgi:exopolysaccharide biosynthesis polyprenyl glycosylphosphotransferase
MTVPLRKVAPVEDVRYARPYLFSTPLLAVALRRALSIATLVAVDVVGLTVGLYAALALRWAVRDPQPMLWNLIWVEERKWLAFLVLLLVLVFWRNRLYGPRELRAGVERVTPSVLLVVALTLAFAIGTHQPFATFGLYVAGAVLVAALITLLRWSHDTMSGWLLRGLGVRRRVLLVGDPGQTAHLRDTLGASRGGIDYQIVGAEPAGPNLRAVLLSTPLDELIVADAGRSESQLLEIAEAAHRRGVKVRIAPRTTELLVQRGRYVPGEAIPLFELRPPMLAGSDWIAKRSFDIGIATVVIVVGLPIWLLLALAIVLTSRGPVFYADERIGLGERTFRLLKFRTMVADAASRQGALESANEASGALFKIREDPRVTSVGRILRRFSLDEIPNLINVLRGEMSLVGPRPLPLRDYARLEPAHRRRYVVLPGMTGLWQIAGRSDLDFDDLVRMDFYYLENWSLWLDVGILVKTVPAVLSRRGAY